MWDYIVLTCRKVKPNTPPYNVGTLFSCHIVKQIQTYLCGNKMVFDNRKERTLPTSAHVQMSPCFWSLSNWQKTVKYILHYPSPTQKSMKYASSFIFVQWLPTVNWNPVTPHFKNTTTLPYSLLPESSGRTLIHEFTLLAHMTRIFHCINKIVRFH